MMSITDPNMSDRFTSEMEEIHNKQLKTYGEIIDATTELCQSHRQFVKSALDTCLKKCKDDEMLFETIQAFKKDLQQKNESLKEKHHAISETMAEIQQKEMQKDNIILKIEKLREEQAKRKELIESQNKANKDRLRNLQKARNVFQDHLGLEIRTILGKSQLVRGEKLQFVFRNINPSDRDSAYIVTMGIKEDGSYQIKIHWKLEVGVTDRVGKPLVVLVFINDFNVVSSDPALECLPVLESRLQETNNLPAFLANVRKEFISQARR